MMFRLLPAAAMTATALAAMTAGAATVDVYGVGKAPAKVTPDGVWPRWKVGHVRAWSEGRTAAGVDVAKKE